MEPGLSERKRIWRGLCRGFRVYAAMAPLSCVARPEAEFRTGEPVNSEMNIDVELEST